MSFAGRTYLITGAASGFGRAVAAHLRDAGAIVFALDKDAVGLKQLEAERLDANLTTIPQDVTDWAGVAESLRHLPAPQGLLNCAGFGLMRQNFLDYTESDIDDVLSVNFKGAVRVSQCVAEKMIRAKISDASIVNVSSLASLQTTKAIMAYAASKAAMDALTKCLAKELGPKGIRVNSINPFVCPDTPMGRYAMEGAAVAVKPSVAPLNRFVRLQDFVDTAAFLLGERSSYLNGVILPLDGGVSA